MKKLKYFLLLIFAMGLLITGCSDRIIYPKHKSTDGYVVKIIRTPANNDEIWPDAEMFYAMPMSATGEEDEIEGFYFISFDKEFNRKVKHMHPDTIAIVEITYFKPGEPLTRKSYNQLKEKVKERIPYRAWKELEQEGILFLWNKQFRGRCGYNPCIPYTPQYVQPATPKVIPMPR